MENNDYSWMKDGMEVECTIMGLQVHDAKLSITAGGWYICQDVVRSNPLKYNYNYKYAWSIGDGSMTLRAYGVHNLKLKNQQEMSKCETIEESKENMPILEVAEDPKESPSIEELSKERDRKVNNDIMEEDVVNNPSHYTSHPSGIECCDVSAYLSSPLAQAFQYVFRGKLKDEYKQELEKTLWWLNKLETVIYETGEKEYSVFSGSDCQRYQVIDNLIAIQESEEDNFKSTFYKLIWFLVEHENNCFIDIIIDWVKKEISLMD